MVGFSLVITPVRWLFVALVAPVLRLVVRQLHRATGVERLQDDVVRLSVTVGRFGRELDATRRDHDLCRSQKELLLLHLQELVQYNPVSARRRGQQPTTTTTELKRPLWRQDVEFYSCSDRADADEFQEAAPATGDGCTAAVAEEGELNWAPVFTADGGRTYELVAVEDDDENDEVIFTYFSR